MGTLILVFSFFQNNSIRYLPGYGPVVPQECSYCGKKFNMGGPIWSAPIHDQEWVTSILADVKSMTNNYPAYDRISAVLTTISEVCFCIVYFNSMDITMFGMIYMCDRCFFMQCNLMGFHY